MTSDGVAVLLATIASGLISGVAGFGFGLVSMGFLAAVLSVQQATATVAILTLCVAILNLWTMRRALPWRESWPLLVTGFPSMVLGVYLLKRLDVAILRAGIALVILGGCAVLVWSPKKARINTPLPWGYAAGLASGLFGGALGMGGPPLVLYNQLRGWDKSVAKGVLCVYFVVTGIWRVALLVVANVMTGATLRMSAALLVPALVSTYAGVWLFRRMSTSVFRWVSLALMLALAAKLLVS